MEIDYEKNQLNNVIDPETRSVRVKTPANDVVRPVMTSSLTGGWGRPVEPRPQGRYFIVTLKQIASGVFSEMKNMTVGVFFNAGSEGKNGELMNRDVTAALKELAGVITCEQAKCENNSEFLRRVRVGKQFVWTKGAGRWQVMAGVY